MCRGGHVGIFALVLALAGPALAEEDSFEFSLEETEGTIAQPAKPPRGKKAVDSAIQQALGKLEWGMSASQVLKVLKGRLKARTDARVREESDILRQDAIYEQAKRQYLNIKRGFVHFDGKKSGWDISPISDEFRHGSHETMLVVDDPAARDHYFFINDRLWKWYRELKPEAFGGGDFAQIGEVFSQQFGKGKSQIAPRVEGGSPRETLSWLGNTTQVSVLARGSDTCLIFESLETLGHLAVLREHALPREEKKNGALEAIFMTEDEREQWRADKLAAPTASEAAVARSRRGRR